MISAAPSVAMKAVDETAVSRSQEHWVTRVVRWSGLPAVVRVETAGDVVIALPRELPARKALGLARLVLDGREYAELTRKLKLLRR
jgi:hypothetical protein